MKKSLKLVPVLALGLVLASCSSLPSSVQTEGRSTPVQVASDVTAVSAGYYHTMFLKSDSTLWAVGINEFGQLGDGTTESRSTPVQVASGVTAVSAGGGHTMFLKSDSTLWAVGGNEFGQLGDGTTESRSTPVQVASDGS